jgi:aromatic ring-opening dioxygenase catalytic subunit (LigB family)
LGRALLYQCFMRGHDLLRWETEGGRLANHVTEGQRIMNTPTSIPVIAVSHPPRRAADAWQFAQGIRRHADTFQVTGVVVVSTHWNRPGESVTVGLEVDDTRQSAAEGRELAERLSERLKSAGLTPELNGGWPGDTMAWRPIVEALADSDVPLVHVSVPVRFGDDLMRLAAIALQSLRHEGILFVGFSDVFGDALLAEEVSFDRRQDVAEGVPV